MCGISVISFNDQDAGNGLYIIGLLIYSGIFSAGLCIYCNRNVRVIVDREPDYCGNRYLWYTNGYSIVEWNHRIPAFVSYG